MNVLIFGISSFAALSAGMIMHLMVPLPPNQIDDDKTTVPAVVAEPIMMKVAKPLEYYSSTYSGPYMSSPVVRQPTAIYTSPPLSGEFVRESGRRAASLGVPATANPFVTEASRTIWLNSWMDEKESK